MRSGQEKTFLIFSGGNDRAVLAFLRALDQCGERAHIVARTPADLILLTRYRRDVVTVRASHHLNMGIFADCVRQARNFAGEKPLVLLPSTEYFNAFLLQHRVQIERMGCEVPLVQADVYAQFTNKSSATHFFSNHGIAVPREVAWDTDMQPPVVAKPRRNVSRDGRSLYPQLLMTANQVAAFRRQPSADEYFYQEYLHGESLYLLFYLPRDGQAPLVWSQRNRLQQPGGKSMLLAEPADFHTCGTAMRLVDALQHAGFWGLGMIEIIRTPNRDVFIEMNPRIWGPLQLSVDHGQPLLPALIGEALHGDPHYYTRASPPMRRHKRYVWLGGLAQTLARRQHASWHGVPRSLLAIAVAGLQDDVYLRSDSWRCFFREAADALKQAWHRERTQD